MGNSVLFLHLQRSPGASERLAGISWAGGREPGGCSTHNAEVPAGAGPVEAEEAGAALKVARAGYRGRALDYALQVPVPLPVLLGTRASITLQRLESRDVVGGVGVCLQD